ncbi:hypothetical protein [Raineyella sp.]|uniref:Uncharacterized protein n=1 Tax=bioreactor metagenome TaxID=1076179 RepID=A0A644XXI2_9ZZZZ|nr:hypothetical protein [Raineyella sp.]MEA5154496.1 hypothetical protein [Raineyella sp.]
MTRAADPDGRSGGQPWHRALGYALCGQDLASLPDRPAPDPSALAAELAAAGWDRDALRRHVAQIRAAGSRWPHPVPAALTAGLSAAQFTATVRALSAEWELAPAHRQVRSAGGAAPAPGDDRLLRELPPHFGKL